MNPVNVQVRRLTTNDVAALGSIAEEVFDHPLEPRRLERFLAQPGCALFVAVAHDTVVAQCTAYAMPRPDKAPSLYIDELGTTPLFRRRGIAAALIDAAVAWGHTCSCTGAWIATEPDNEPARALYRRIAGDPIEAVVYQWDITEPEPATARTAP